MDWRKLKNILIFVFLIVNILLFLMLNATHNRESGISQETMSELITLLSKNKIEISESVIPKTSYGMRNCYIHRIISDEPEFARKILGAEYIRISEGNYTAGDKSLIIEEDRFEYTNTNPNEKLDKVSKTGEILMSANEIDTFCRDLLQKYGLGGQTSKFKGINEVSDISIRAIYTKEFDDYEFFDSHLIIELTANGATSINGKNWLSDDMQADDKDSIRNISGVLADFIDNPDRDKTRPCQIISITQGYYIGKEAEKYKTTLPIPAWQIATDENIYYYDARNGSYVNQ